MMGPDATLIKLQQWDYKLHVRIFRQEKSPNDDKEEGKESFSGNNETVFPPQ